MQTCLAGSMHREDRAVESIAPVFTIYGAKQPPINTGLILKY